MSDAPQKAASSSGMEPAPDKPRKQRPVETANGKQNSHRDKHTVTVAVLTHCLPKPSTRSVLPFYLYFAYIVLFHLLKHAPPFQPPLSISMVHFQFPNFHVYSMLNPQHGMQKLGGPHRESMWYLPLST